VNIQLKVKILEKFHTQADFAKAVGVSETVLSRIIRNRKEADSLTQEKLAQKLGCKSFDLFPSK
jgi:DNA-binding XRE family transcriptional regulator